MNPSSDSQDRLEAMLQQEMQFYRCPNYLQQRRTVSSWSYGSIDQRLQQAAVGGDDTTRVSPLHHLVEECAKIITDQNLVELSPSSVRQVHYPPNELTLYRKDRTSKSLGNAADNNNDSDRGGDVGDGEQSLFEDTHMVPWRQQMCSWSYTCVDSFGLDRVLVSIAFDLLDRYLARTSSLMELSRQEFQLVSMTALYITIKLQEPFQKLGIEHMIDMSRGFFQSQDFQDTELDILEMLNWRISPPIPAAICEELWHILLHDDRQYAQAGTIPQSCIDLSYTVLEAAVADSFYVPHKHSHVALAAIRVVLEDYGYDARQLCGPVEEILQAQKDKEFEAVYRHMRLGCPI